MSGLSNNTRTAYRADGKVLAAQAAIHDHSPGDRLCLAGAGFGRHRGRTHLLKKNDIAVLNRGELHRLKAGVMANKLLLLQIDTVYYERLHPDHSYVFIYCCSPCHEA